MNGTRKIVKPELTIALPEFSKAVLLHEYKDEHGAVSVYENDQYRWIQSGAGNIQSAMRKTDASNPVLPYFPALLSALLFLPAPQRILIIGLGGGELIRFFKHCLPDTELFAIEKSRAMIHAFNCYFQQNTLPIDVIADDICTYTSHRDQRPYDMVFLDVYGENSLPACLYEKHFYYKLSGMLSDQGILSINLIVRDEAEAIELLKSIRKAFHKMTLCLSVGKHMNIVVLAFNQPPKIKTIQQLNKNAIQLNASSSINFNELIDNIFASNPNNGTHLSF